jgi:predicted HTH domain antitoxin
VGQVKTAQKSNEITAIPELLDALNEFTHDLRFFAALAWYRKNKLSLGKAAELAGCEKLDFIARMQREQEPVFDYGPDELSSVFSDVAKLP